jgi:tRNA pseudouridine38-40 synthase
LSTYKLVVQYDGTRYAGWQVQPGLPTIQGELTARLRRICNEPGLRVAGAARTDAGTHALGQVATFTTSRDWREGKLRHILNKLLPRDITVAESGEVPPEFHARRSASGRIYRYHIVTGDLLSPFLAPYAYHYRTPLDVEAMANGARALLGEHDFSSFRAAGNPSATPVKTIRRCEVIREGERVSCTVEGNSFLQHMVRIMAGTLLEVGRGRWDASRVKRILQARDRAAAGPTLPAHGLFLVRVLYEGPERRDALPEGENQ